LVGNADVVGLFIILSTLLFPPIPSIKKENIEKKSEKKSDLEIKRFRNVTKYSISVVQV
jgi:hypothetical protein